MVDVDSDLSEVRTKVLCVHIYVSFKLNSSRSKFLMNGAPNPPSVSPHVTLEYVVLLLHSLAVDILNVDHDTVYPVQVFRSLP